MGSCAGSREYLRLEAQAVFANLNPCSRRDPHLSDLLNLLVDKNGNANQTFIANDLSTPVSRRL